MSGGVDSSTAAAILKSQGHEIVGFSLQLWNQRRSRRPEGQSTPPRCCSLEDVYDARGVAAQLNFPFYVLNMEEEFEQKVVFPFVREYLLGRTPIPCVPCNTHIKFTSLLDFAERLGFEKVATGHYARVEKDELTGRTLLKRAVDRKKDQSYFLFELTQEQLARTIFPLGSLTKQEVRAIATHMGLPIAQKSESQEICFIPDGKYARFVEDYMKDGLAMEGQDFTSDERKRLPKPASGEIVTTSGTVIGQHRGIHRYTIGQRRGLKVALGKPLYVTEIDREHNRIVVGEEESLLTTTLRAIHPNWISIAELTGPQRVTAKVRYRHEEAPATIEPLDDGSVRVRFDEPQRAITPGQAAVFYDGDIVVGGGWIA